MLIIFPVVISDTNHETIIDAVPLSDRVIRLTVSGADGTARAFPADYSLSETTGGNGPINDFVIPAQTGRQSFLKGFEGGDNILFGNPDAPVRESYIFLKFERPMESGKTYTLTVNNPANSRGIYFRVDFDEKMLVNGSVKANHVGFLPDSPKIAYIGNYLGDAGPMEIKSPLECEIRNSGSGAIELTVPARFRAEDEKMSGETVYDCDFSEFETIGSYYVLVKGIGRTHNFNISPDVYNDVSRKSLRLYYYQRDNLDLLPQYAGIWHREGGHTETDRHARIHESHIDSPLYGGEKPGGTIDVTGGWFDAGDYGKYVITSAPALFPMFSAYELYPEKFTDDLNIPESGNGAPDLLDETKWETDWLSKMQAPDGGVYDRVVTQYYANSMPGLDMQERDIAPKNTHVTALFAAELAAASRVYKSNDAFEKAYPGYADSLLLQSEKAWNFLERHPHATPAQGPIRPAGIGGGDYSDPPLDDGTEGDADNRAWAAAELYKTTGGQKYHEAFVRYWSMLPPLFGYNEFQHHQRKASWAYATTKNHPVNAGIAKQIRDAMRDEIRQENQYGFLYNTQKNVYRNGFRQDVIPYLGWGNYTKSTTYAWQLIMASYLLEDTSLIDAAKANLDFQLGANPLYFSYITGVGFDYPKNPLHTPSILDGVEEPVPGIPVYGIYYSLPAGNIYGRKATDHSVIYPAGKEADDPYPVLRRYFDVSSLVEMSEFGIGDAAPGAMVFAYFSNPEGKVITPSPPGPQPPSLPVPSGTNKEGLAGTILELLKGLIRRIWEVAEAMG
ncbi:MAG TPA: cellulose 1,4-beta-cellobiosidase [Candidatus Diapherotrites archaeon]|uniref:Cellulose 1,4-beta-cellobiosidase n=1 Tax=Candidatus Iainarchaeum sp. TaxID=3101447 RepID=A0A7J4IWQ4_9ARCH|nr:cellulose 1,4-beta-cellobiosidase [Candidatus Diapherotrites archaeon]